MALNQKYDRDDWKAFVEAARNNPKDMDVLWPAADWLEENDVDPDRAAYMRLCQSKSKLGPEPMMISTAVGASQENKKGRKKIHVQLSYVEVVQLMKNPSQYIRIITNYDGLRIPLTPEGEINRSGRMTLVHDFTKDQKILYAKPVGIGAAAETYATLKRMFEDRKTTEFTTTFEVVSEEEGDPDHKSRKDIEGEIRTVRNRMIQNQIKENRLLSAPQLNHHSWLDLPIPIYGPNGFMQGLITDWDWWKDNYEEMTTTEPISTVILTQGCPECTTSELTHDYEIYWKKNLYRGRSLSGCLSVALERPIQYLTPNLPLMIRNGGQNVAGYNRSLMTAEFVSYPYQSVSKNLFLRSLHRSANGNEFRGKIEDHYRILHITPEFQNGFVVTCSVLLLNGDFNANYSKHIDFQKYLPEFSAWRGPRL